MVVIERHFEPHNQLDDRHHRARRFRESRSVSFNVRERRDYTVGREADDSSRIAHLPSDRSEERGVISDSGRLCRDRRSASNPVSHDDRRWPRFLARSLTVPHARRAGIHSRAEI